MEENKEKEKNKNNKLLRGETAENIKKLKGEEEK